MKPVVLDLNAKINIPFECTKDNEEKAPMLFTKKNIGECMLN